MSIGRRRLLNMLAPPSADIKTLLDATNRSLTTQVSIVRRGTVQGARVKRPT